MKNCPKIIHLHCANKGKLCEVCVKFKKFKDKYNPTKNKER